MMMPLVIQVCMTKNKNASLLRKVTKSLRYMLHKKTLVFHKVIFEILGRATGPLKQLFQRT